MPNKSDLKPEYIQRYTQVKVRPSHLKGEIRVIMALGMKSMDLATSEIIGDENIDDEYKDHVQSIHNIKNPKDIPYSSSIKEFFPVLENLSILEKECGSSVLFNNKALIIP